ncbi:TetR/AcrR family transcriptional regulator [Gordonia sp. TBRC 11910]|uniref:TetR/AcrR family transcriptional regulator n=1 Tax=Gordonia asplenii TaxID=2725283 RepID=A0A848KWF7_9ACTN|nr:TetR/AcrR family transcriptional regulator [Gordonia asplenii]NMO03174.1 TetR/AcrR family transcriptional regulator [Gordonia asplenii]
MAHIPAVERRRQIIEVAARVIAREGVAKATTRRIGAEAKANIGTLHYTFGTKDELLDATYEYCWDMAREIVDAAVEAGAGPGGTAREFLSRYAELAIADPDLIAAQYQLLCWGITQQARKEQSGELMGQLDDLVIEALDRSDWAHGLPISHHRLGRIIVSLIDGILLRFIVTHSADECRADVATATELLETLLSAPAPSK